MGQSQVSSRGLCNSGRACPEPPPQSSRCFPGEAPAALPFSPVRLPWPGWDTAGEHGDGSSFPRAWNLSSALTAVPGQLRLPLGHGSVTANWEALEGTDPGQLLGNHGRSSSELPGMGTAGCGNGGMGRGTGEMVDWGTAQDRGEWDRTGHWGPCGAFLGALCPGSGVAVAVPARAGVPGPGFAVPGLG